MQDEEKYVVPARDTTSLYAQLRNIMAQNIPRSSVK